MGHVYRFGKRGADWRCLLQDDSKGRLFTDHNKGNPQLCTQHCPAANEDVVQVRYTREQLRLRADNETIHQLHKFTDRKCKDSFIIPEQLPECLHTRVRLLQCTKIDMLICLHCTAHSSCTSTVSADQTLTGQPFMMSSGHGNSFQLFSTVDNLTCLCQAPTVYTFAASCTIS